MAQSRAPTTPAADAPARPREVAHKPFVPADMNVPEFTVKAVALGLLLAVVLGAANAYVGLRVGMTVSASIPAAVLSMGLLRLFRSHTILENNIVQTTASAAESLAAGVIFTIPAFVLASQVPWSSIHLVPTLLIAATGGILGVLFTVPLRRAFVVDAKLPFPEGTACAEVLEVGQEGGAGVKVLGGALVLGAAYSFMHLGMRAWTASMEGAVRVGQGIAYFGTNLAPILLGVGYLVGLRIAALIAGGGLFAWFVLIPAFMILQGYPTAEDGTPLAAMDAAYTVWDSKIRLVGGGAMITGGLAALWKVRSSLANAVREGVAGFGKGSARAARDRDGSEGGVAGAKDVVRARTERDMPLPRILMATGVMMAVTFGVLYALTGSVPIAIAAGLAAGTAGFLFSAVAGYMAGVVGSSNNPISGVTIVTLVFTALLVLGVGALTGFDVGGGAGFAAALTVGAIIACAGAIAGDNLQDLKTGHIVGATPWKQQTGQILGVIVAAIVAAPVLNLLHEAYTMGSVQLAAPQAALMANILDGIFAGTLDWSLIGLGMILGAALAFTGLPVMAVAVGVYLPLLLSVPILAGGLIHFAVTRAFRKRRPESLVTTDEGTPAPEAEQPTADARKHALLESGALRTGLLFASGLIAGEAIVGVLVAPILVAGVDPALFGPAVFGVLTAALVAMFAPWKAAKWLALGVGVTGIAATTALVRSGAVFPFEGTAGWPGLLVLAYVAVLMWYVPTRALWTRRADAE